jgi:hypothetical protein
MDFPLLETVMERDIDLLILEELWANEDFRTKFRSFVGLPSDRDLKFKGAWHSVCHPTLGESDLVVEFSDQEGSLHAVLIENKVDAIPQPDQANRYRKRGEVGIDEGLWQRFTTCILAPERYLRNTSEAGLYDTKVSYETLSELVGTSLKGLPERAKYRQELLKHAIDQNRRGYSPKQDDRVTLFWRNYWECVTARFPDLRMKEPGPKPAEATWIEFHPFGFPKGFWIYHKLKEGTIDLQTPVKEDRLPDLVLACKAWLKEGTQVVKTGKSCSIRTAVQKLDPACDFAEQKQEAFAGMEAAAFMASLGKDLSALDQLQER